MGKNAQCYGTLARSNIEVNVTPTSAGGRKQLSEVKIYIWWGECILDLNHCLMWAKTTEVSVSRVKIYILWAEVYSYYVISDGVLMNLKEGNNML
jgi:hypothetical protein